jgi:hypothetical protein
MCRVALPLSKLQKSCCASRASRPEPLALLLRCSPEQRPAELLRIRGPRRLSPPRAPPGAIARSRVGYPDRRSSSTFCRRPVTRTAGGAALARCTNRAPLYVPTEQGRSREPRRPLTSLAQGPPGRGVSCDPPRREAHSTNPKVLSVVGGPAGLNVSSTGKPAEPASDLGEG